MQTFARDLNTGIVINTDDSHYRQILSQRAKSKESIKVQESIADLQKDFAEIKQLLSAIVSEKKYG
jgi:hypothetical protein